MIDSVISGNVFCLPETESGTAKKYNTILQEEGATTGNCSGERAAKPIAKTGLQETNNGFDMSLHACVTGTKLQVAAFSVQGSCFSKGLLFVGG